ncbi:MAG: hypothetical protein A3H44_06020 [Gammaproteobacteria bacterium RIFCSPLOWO2_02_FULL_57_10]|nr:MAG: hypothetical protein A3H44_06020 [Gammaproteobacteria bacterium RIFCSPLOWO2_02_FULL_57_10]
MRRLRTLQLTIAVTLFTAIGPILLAIYLAQQQGLNLEFERVMGYAKDVIYRSDRVVNQLRVVLDELAETSTEGCTDALIGEMQQLATSLEYIEIIAHLDGSRMDCSSLGRHPDPIDLGPVSLITSTGNQVYLSVVIPQASAIPFLGLARGNIIAIANRAQAIDLTVEQEGVLFATFTPITGVIRIANGEVDQRWINSLGNETESVFIDADYIVGIARSEEISLTGALAAVPIEVLNQRVREFAILLVPIGLITGLGLTALVIHLARQRMSLYSEIKLGLKRQEFFLVYQPIVDLQTEQCIGAEALIRWRRRNGSVSMPDAFIPTAEDSGLIGQLTDRVIELAKKDMPAFLQVNPDFALAINLSAADLQSANVLQQLQEIPVGDSGSLTVEVTERVMLEPEAAGKSIKAMRDSGLRVALDDFGTGYSSLSYLETMQFDCLKIDKLFVEAIDTGAATNRVVLHIIEMARTLRLELLAEGVETRAQADFLREQNVHYAQGWLFGKPVEAELFIARYTTGAS